MVVYICQCACEKLYPYNSLFDGMIRSGYELQPGMLGDRQTLLHVPPLLASSFIFFRCYLPISKFLRIPDILEMQFCPDSNI